MVSSGPMTFGGSNQYMSYPALPNFNPSGGGGGGTVASDIPNLTTFSGVPLNTHQPGNYFKNSPGGVSDLGGNMFTAPTMDPAFTNQFYSMLTQLMGGQGGQLQNNILSFLTGGPSSTPGATQLGQMAQTGDPFNASPEWQAMIQAQQQNIAQNEANLKEQFAFSGDLQSSPFGTAMGNFASQTTADQNSLLGQLMQSSYENAMGRQMQTGMGLESMAGNESQFLNQLFASSALTSPQLFQKQKSSLLGGIGSLLGAVEPIAGSVMEGLSGGGGISDVMSSLAGLFAT